MLSAGAAEIYLKVFESTLQIVINGLIDKHLHILKEEMGIVAIVKIVLYRCIFAGHILKLSESARVRESAAVEDKAATIAGDIHGYASVFIREAVNTHRKSFIFNRLITI